MARVVRPSSNRTAASEPQTKPAEDPEDGTSGQDRDSYTDAQDRESYTVTTRQTRSRGPGKV